jgi:O-acetyl-ADP-ribose deacetylase (regulator of RNase III)
VPGIVPKIVLLEGDITTQDVDAVVNAANTALRPGGGVDGAITRAAGPEALADRERVIRERGHPPLPTGSAVATIGGALPARWIIHTAGPVYAGGPDDALLLASCHTESLRVADELGARTVAFPAISTGVYGYPLEQAAPVAIAAVGAARSAVDEVRFVLFDDAAMAAFGTALNERAHR